MKSLLFAACVLLVSTGCFKGKMCCGLPLGTEMIRTQTQCADTWGYGSNDIETVTKLSNYLAQKKIIASSIILQPTTEQVFCMACTCSKGFVFHVWVENQYTSALTAEGFTVK